MDEDRQSSDETREIRIIFPRDLAPIWIPKEARYHMREAIKQTLLAFRSMMDAGIRYYEEAFGESSKGRRVKKVKIE